jgi:siroheme synthase
LKHIRGARKRSGSLVCVGTGMTLGSHLSPLARSYIENADVVFVAVSDGIVELWLMQMNRDVRSLQHFYREGKSRAKTYREMVEAMLVEVRSGKNVCGAFYGHPGVFALPPHEAIRRARREGFSAHMEPGISSEDCLYADLGIDPATFGCQHHEASQLLFYKRRIDPGAYLIVWQAGVVGNRTPTTGSAYDVACRQLLVERLAQDYSLDHKLIVYRAATLPTQAPRIERIALRKLAAARIEAPDTLVFPPARKLIPDAKMLRRLARLERTRA